MRCQEMSEERVRHEYAYADGVRRYEETGHKFAVVNCRGKSREKEYKM